MRTNLLQPWIVAIAVSGLTGCDLSVAAHLTKPDEARDGGIDASEQEHERPEDEDASDGEADGSDGQPHVEEDADVNPLPPDADAQIGAESGLEPVRDAETPVPQPCAEDSECTTEQYCSKANVCLARCREPEGCAGPRGVFGLLAHGAETLLAKPATTDSLGNLLSNGTISSWDGSNAPKQVTTGLAAYMDLYFVADGSLYLTLAGRGPLELHRISLASGVSTLLSSDSPRSVWHTQNYIWWSTLVESYCSLWRLPRAANAVPEHVRRVAVDSVFAKCFVGGSEDLVIFAESSVAPFYRQSIDGSSATVVSLADVPDRMQVVGDFAYFFGLFNGGHLLGAVDLRVTAASSANHRILGGVPNSGSSSSFVQDYQLLGDWAYWTSFGSRDGRAYVYHGRTRTDLSREPEQFEPIDAEGGTSGSGLAVSPDGTKIIYVHPREQRLFTRSVPPLPCTASAECPSGLTCQSDQTCR